MVTPGAAKGGKVKMSDHRGAKERSQCQPVVENQSVPFISCCLSGICPGFQKLPAAPQHAISPVSPSRAPEQTCVCRLCYLAPLVAEILKLSPGGASPACTNTHGLGHGPSLCALLYFSVD